MATQNSSKGGGTSGTSTGGKESGGRISDAYQSTTRAVSGAGRKLGSNPVGAVAAGFAVGAVLGAVIPATRRERDALQPLASKVTDAARTAARQAADAGRDKLNRLTGEVVTQVGSKVVDAVGSATS